MGNFNRKLIRNPPEISIILGEHDRTKLVDREEGCDHIDCSYNIINMTASVVVIHEEYRMSKVEPSHYNDIALVKLKWPISFDGNNIRPVCLPEEDDLKNLDLTGKTLTATGFGKGKYPLI